MSRNSPVRGLLVGLPAIAVCTLTATAQITTWPNSLSMWFDRGEPGNEKVRLRVGPVRPHAELAFLFLPDGVTDATDLSQTISEGATLLHFDQAGSDGWFDARFIRKDVPRGAECGVYSYAHGVVRFEGAFIANPRVFKEPPVPEPGAPDIQVFPGGAVILHGPGAADDEVVLADRPLVEAIRRASPNDVIGVYGDLTIGDREGMWLGGAQDPFKAHHVHWGPKPMRFAVVGMTPDAKITGFAISKDVASSQESTGGIGDVLFANLTIENPRYGLSAISANRGKTFGRIRVYDCRFQAHPEALAEGALSGYGAKWWIRVPARGSYDIRNCTFAPVQEHCIYVDSPQGDNFFVGIEHNGSWRTAIQIVNRAWELPSPPPGSSQDEADAWYADLLVAYESGEQLPTPSGQGRILIKDVTLRDLWGEGGAGITVAGFLGDVYLQNVTAIDPDPFHGVFTAWTDGQVNHGVHAYTGADGNLYSTRSVTLRGTNLDLPRADRDHVVISGVEHVHVFDFDIAGNHAAISLDSPFGTPNMRGQLAVVDGVVTRLPADENVMIANGNMEFYTTRKVSQHPGFRSSAKIRIWTHTLTDAEIDSRWP